MKKKLLTTMNLFVASAISLFTAGAVAQTNVTVDADAEWIGAMNVYNLQGGYEFYSDWGLADIKTEKNTTNNTLTLFPNYNTYNAADPFWSNGAMGNKIMEALSLVIDDALVGDNITFSGTVVSNTLVDGYTVKAFVKALTVDWVPLGEANQIIDAAGNFTVFFDASQYADAAHVQYGFIVTGLNGNPADLTANGNMVVAAGDPQEPQEPAEVVVTLNASSPLIAYANWFDLETNDVTGDVWSLADLKTTLNTSNNTIILQPNFSAYGTGTDPYWANGEIGNKIFEGNTYVEDNTLVGANVTFQGSTVSNTLANGYDAVAFIKVYDASYNLLIMQTEELVGATNFSVNVDVAEFPSAAHVQYGFSVTGLNANPNQEAALGSAIVSGEVLSIASNVLPTVAVYPNPADTFLTIASANTIASISVYNALGQMVMQNNVNAKEASIDVSSLNTGVYVLSTVSRGSIQTTRFIKK